MIKEPERMTSEGPRARYRQQVREEIQQQAWQQIESAGASALSLKAIATGMGMTAPALYRYYTGRDELLTQLIVSAYRDLAELAEAAAVSAEAPQCLIAIAGALRQWALAHPQRYLLLYGTPVPGYRAPDEATDLARRIFAPITTAFDALPGTDGTTAVTFWTRLHGVLSLELAGHFTTMNFDPAELWDAEVRSLIQPGRVAVGRASRP